MHLIIAKELMKKKEEEEEKKGFNTNPENYFCFKIQRL